MKGYRNVILALTGVATSTWLAYVGIEAGSDLLALATLLGAKDAALVGAMVARGYNKKVENGGVK
jgi:hypothetical protein